MSSTAFPMPQNFPVQIDTDSIGGGISGLPIEFKQLEASDISAVKVANITIPAGAMLANNVALFVLNVNYVGDESGNDAPVTQFTMSDGSVSDTKIYPTPISNPQLSGTDGIANISYLSFLLIRYENRLIITNYAGSEYKYNTPLVEINDFVTDLVDDTDATVSSSVDLDFSKDINVSFEMYWNSIHTSRVLNASGFCLLPNSNFTDLSKQLISVFALKMSELTNDIPADGVSHKVCQFNIPSHLQNINSYLDVDANWNIDGITQDEYSLQIDYKIYDSETNTLILEYPLIASALFPSTQTYKSLQDHNNNNYGKYYCYKGLFVSEMLNYVVPDVVLEDYSGKNIRYELWATVTSAAPTDVLEIRPIAVFNSAEPVLIGDSTGMNGLQLPIAIDDVNGLYSILFSKFDTANIVNDLTGNAADKVVSQEGINTLYTSVQNLIALVNSDDTTLDTLQEIVDFIKVNKTTLDSLSISNIAGLSTALGLKADLSHIHAISDITNLSNTLTVINSNISNRVQYSDIQDNLATSYTNKPISQNQAVILKSMIDNLTTLVTSDDTSLDTLQEIVNFIKVNKTTLDSLSISNIAGLSTALGLKADLSHIHAISDITNLSNTLTVINSNISNRVQYSDIQDNLATSYTNKPISQNQAVLLKGMIDNLTTLVTSDDTSLDTLQEIVNFIKINKDTLDALSIESIAGLSAALIAKADLSYVNTELANKSDTTHNHSLANLSERSYNSLTNLPDLSLKSDKHLSFIDRSVNYTLSLSDAFTFQQCSHATGISVTVPPNSSVAFSIGTQIFLTQVGLGSITVVAGSGVTINSRGGMLSSGNQYGQISLLKTATDTWLLVGDLV